MRTEQAVPVRLADYRPPDWLVEGMLALQPGRDSDSDAELLRTVVASKKISPLEDIIRQRRTQLDVPSRQLHEAYAIAGESRRLGMKADIPPMAWAPRVWQVFTSNSVYARMNGTVIVIWMRSGSTQSRARNFLIALKM